MEMGVIIYELSSLGGLEIQTIHLLDINVVTALLKIQKHEMMEIQMMEMGEVAHEL